MRFPHVTTAIRGSVFTIRGPLEAHRDAFALLVIGGSLLTSGYLVASRELTRTTTTIVESKPAPGPAAAKGAPATGKVINLNTASAAQLETLPRVGPVMAQKILAYRAAHGAFRTVDELDAVSGIGPATLGQLRPLVTVN